MFNTGVHCAGISKVFAQIIRAILLKESMLTIYPNSTSLHTHARLSEEALEGCNYSVEMTWIIFTLGYDASHFRQ